MLEIIKESIQQLSNITFNEFYMKYVFDIQDQNMEAEFNQITTAATAYRTDVKFVDKLLNNAMKGLV